MSEPDGVTIEDRSTGQLRHDGSFLVFDQGRLRTLRLRVGRGSIREANAAEKRAFAAELGKHGAKARSLKLTPERRSEIAREAAQKRWGKA